MGDYVKVLEMTEDEIGIIINALNDLRNKLIKAEKLTDPIDEVLIKIFNSPEKKRYYRRQKLFGDR